MAPALCTVMICLPPVLSRVPGAASRTVCPAPPWRVPSLRPCWLSTEGDTTRMPADGLAGVAAEVVVVIFWVAAAAAASAAMPDMGWPPAAPAATVATGCCVGGRGERLKRPLFGRSTISITVVNSTVEDIISDKRREMALHDGSLRNCPYSSAHFPGREAHTCV